MNVYQFAFHDRVKNTPPSCKMGTLLSMLENGEKLARDDKDYVFQFIEPNRYGKYKLAGWVFDFQQYMNRYLVDYRHYGWIEVWALDKISIRNSTYSGSGILEIIQTQ